VWPGTGAGLERVERCGYGELSRGGQGGQGRTGAQTCAPRPAPPSKMCAPRPAPPCAPARMGEPGHPAAGPRPTRPSSPGSQAALLTRPGPAVAVRAASCATAWLQLQVPGWPGRGPARSALCLPSCPSLSCLSAASCASKQMLLLAPITCCSCRTMRSAQIIHNPTCHDTSIDITTF
jgi:hypothetical protein